MIDLSKVRKLNWEEALTVSELPKIAREAEKLEMLIQETYDYPHFEEMKIVICEGQDETGKVEYVEYLTKAGDWEFWKTSTECGKFEWLYEIRCSKEGIYQCLLDEYLCNQHFQEMCKAEGMLEIIKRMNKFNVFREFIERTKQISKRS